MNLENYKLEDFLMDDTFVAWVRNPDSDEARFWETWLCDHPDKRQPADEARKIVKSMSFGNLSFSQNELTELWSKIQAETVQKNTPVHRSLQRNVWKYLKVAAVLVPVVVAAAIAFWPKSEPVNPAIVENPLIEKVNPKGQKLTLFLSDGTRVKLNSDSRLTYLKSFDAAQRIVTLEGEAFFEVTPDPNRPFTVVCGDVATQVLGTSFNIQAYPEDQKVKIAVLTGKVSIEDRSAKEGGIQAKTTVLLPSEMGTYSKRTKQTTVSGYDSLAVFGWSDKTLYFENASMEEFVSRIERWYGVDVILKKSTPVAKGITGIYRDVPLEEILMGHKMASEFDYQILPDGKVIIK